MKTIEIRFKSSSEAVLDILRKQTDPPTGIRILRIMKNPWFWGKIEEKKIKIWPKGPTKDISSSYIKGNINDDENGSVLVGEIVNDPVLRVPSWLFALVALVGFPCFGFFMYSFMSLGKYLIPAFIVSIVSIGIFLIGTLQRISEGQEEDLEKFLRQVFEQKAISIKIA